MNTFLAVHIILFTTALAEDQGYHSVVGIPEAERIYADEMKPDAPRAKVFSYLSDHYFLVGVVITVNESSSVCGASLLTNSRAITAAHCWWDGWRQAQEFTLVFDSEHLFKGGSRITTKNIMMHDRWNPKTLANDLAMIGFDYFEYTKKVQPIELPTDRQDINYIGTGVVASGYGKAMTDSLGFAPILKQIDVRMVVVPTTQCINSTTYLMKRTICVRTSDKFCIRHSGGPLVFEKETERFLIGVASFGDYSCSQNKDTLAGFVRITSYMRWIENNL